MRPRIPGQAGAGVNAPRVALGVVAYALFGVHDGAIKLLLVAAERRASD